MVHPNTQPGTDHGDAGHEVLAGVLQIRNERLQVLLWQRAQGPHRYRWALPGGRLAATEDVEASIRRQLAEKVDVQELTHVEQLSVFSAPERVPGRRIVATAFLGLVPSNTDPEIPADTQWQPVGHLPATAFDHESIVLAARDRLRAKLSYTNIGFALAPAEFTLSELRGIYSAALDYRVAATNLQRVLSRRGALQATGRTVSAGPSGGRPPALFRFTSRDLQITDPFAVLRPPLH
ncbi:NUDIX hydrolase [Haloactinomyces albus]|uniref:8-oxo-dGTP diphosphatase n=1 Tax=Haloactinomyces albus TaxID=1352928 RepID=A0AAE3ZC63_9ACTN|nr:NUDIX domain-containing protein [Haloactinomyces albus]MDR7300547.1 8-oxo-dGTP diphosphatase [Haloactinomyces albus]